jgi:general secretion pathway protein A
MYETFYGLTERPFNLTPDPKFLYLSEKHKEAFAHLLFGIKNRSGFVMVTGEIGTGKTTICRTLLGQLDDDTEVAFIFNPYLSPEELLRKINEDFGIRSKADTVKGLIDELNEYLLDRAGKGKNCVLVIDEAQNLEPKVLEQIRLLSNLETETQKLIQIVLIGQPELGQHLELPELRQLCQRITARYHLTPLDPQETLQYIAYRLRVAGGRRKVRFTAGAVRTVYKLSGGVPRMINAICDRALLIGYTQEQADITPGIIKKAYKEVRGEHFRSRAKEFWKQLVPSRTFVGAALLIILAGAVLTNPFGDRFWNLVRDVFATLPASTPVEATVTPNKDVVVAAIPDSPAQPPPAVEEIKSAVEPSTPAAHPSIQESLAALDPVEARGSAAAALLRAWNLAPLSGFPANGDDTTLVEFARENGLACELLDITTDQVAAINLPAMIRVTPSGKSLWVALIGIDDDTWKISSTKTETLAIPRAELEKIYAKEAALLWRDPSPAASVIKESMRGDAVKELQSNLQILGLLTTAPNGEYDAPTLDVVRKIQAHCGINVDGIIGKQTRMVLSSWLPTADGPRLTDAPALLADIQATVAKQAPLAPVAPVEPKPAVIAPPAPDTRVEPTEMPAIADATPSKDSSDVAPESRAQEAPTAPDQTASGNPASPIVAVEELERPTEEQTAQVSTGAAAALVDGSRSGELTVTMPERVEDKSPAPSAADAPPLIAREGATEEKK